MFFRILLAYATVYIVWGSTYYFIKVAVTTIDPLYVVGFRFFLGGIGLIIYSVIVNIKNVKKILPGKFQIVNAAVIGIALIVGGNGLVTISELKVDSYIAALVISMVPIIVLIFDKMILRKKILPVTLVGALVGIVGTCLLFYKGNKSVPNVDIYILLLFLAVISWAFGTTLSKKLSLPSDVILNTGIQSATAGLVSIIICNFLQPFADISWKSISAESWGSLAFLTTFGSVAFCAYSYLLKHQPNDRVVTYSFVNPVIAVFIGILIGKEPPVPFLIPSIGLILTGLLLLFYGDKIRQRIKKHFTIKSFSDAP